MSNQSRLLIIADIESLIVTILPLANQIAKSNNLFEEKELDCFFDWAINQLLMQHFRVTVMHHYRHDFYLCLYESIHFELLSAFKRCINLNDLYLFRGDHVKTLINGKDLFITRRISYNHL